jgi:DNA-binding NtrC family response regulator
MPACDGWREETPRRPCVLVVEADPDVLRLFGLILDNLGAAMAAARDATRARAILATGTIDFAYIALAPRDERNGVALADAAVARGIPVAMTSGHPAGVAAATEAGHPILQKPLRVKDIIRPLILGLPDWRPQAAAELPSGSRD